MSFKSVFVSIFFGVILFGASSNTSAQSNQVIHLNNHVYSYIKNLQLRGFFTDLNPTSFPYTRGDVNNSLSKVDKASLTTIEQFWIEQIEREIGFNNKSVDDIYVYGMLEGGFDLNNTLNENPLRPQADKVFFIPNGAVNLYAEKDRFAAQLGLRHNLFYDLDKRGVNTLSRYYVRSEDYYLGFNGDFLKVYLGRYSNLWAPYGEASTMISANARSFDRLNITIGNSWFQVSGIFGELDNLGKDGTFDRGTLNLINGVKRYLALHRIDIKLTDGLRLGFFDGLLYSSENSLPSLKYLTPVNFLFFERNTNPVNDGFNALFGGMIWFQHQKLTMHLQLMIDDIIIKDGNLESHIEPTTFAITHSLNYADVLNFMDLGYEAEIISYQTYNTDYAEGRYLFLKRGIANQFNDYVFVTAFAKLYAYDLLKGFMLKPSVSFLAQGEQSINQPYVSEKPNGKPIDVILTGTEEKTSRISLDFLYNPIPEFWVEGNVGYNYLSDTGHTRGVTDSRFTGRIEVGFRLNFNRYTN